MSTVRDKYRAHKHIAKQRGIDFKLRYEDWMEIWLESGHWHERGASNGKYVMARYGDQGAYEKGNVKIILHEDNLREANYARDYKSHSEATKKQISNTMKGQTRLNVARANSNRVWTEEMRKESSDRARRMWAKRKGK